MKRILVIGCPGAGKSWFSRLLRDRTGIPLYYLDQIWHNPDRTHVPEEVFQAKVSEILEKETWIIDGNYVSSLEKRLKYCDTVFYFCFSTEECLAGARRRIGTVREDLPWSETELDPVFAEYIRTFHEKITPKTEKLLEKTTAQVIRFYDREEENKYIRENLGGE
ncbi:MAG: adenylate kinase [Erysipelotrichales bacterium]|nr:adenylate kinase [Erysipelotrichales bacterium]MBQ1385927.1 adenylate kinase [Erysipelotrichales bacterium]